MNKVEEEDFDLEEFYVEDDEDFDDSEDEIFSDDFEDETFYDEDEYYEQREDEDEEEYEERMSVIYEHMDKGLNRGHIEEIKAILNKKNSKLINAVVFNNYKECQKLLESGKNVNTTDKTKGFCKRNSLMIAAYEGNYDICKLLIAYKININYQDSSGDTALTVAVIQNHYDICKLLIQNGADINIKDKNGHTIFGLIENQEDIDDNNKEKAKSVLQTYSYLYEKKEQLDKLEIDEGILEAVISDNNSFKTNKQNIDKLIEQYSISGSVSVVESDDL